jgi:hypothetical protein
MVNRAIPVCEHILVSISLSCPINAAHMYHHWICSAAFTMLLPFKVPPGHLLGLLKPVEGM